MGGMGSGVLVAVASLQAPGTPLAVPVALIGTLQVAVVHGDEQMMALFFGEHPVRGGGG